MKPSSAGTRHPPALFTNVVTARASADGPANAVGADAEAHLYIAALPGATKATLERELRGSSATASTTSLSKNRRAA